MQFTKLRDRGQLRVFHFPNVYEFSANGASSLKGWGIVPRVFGDLLSQQSSPPKGGLIKTRLRRQKGWHRAVERVGDGAEQLCFALLDETVGGDSLHAGVKNILFDL